jgi:uncharacterized protein (DUF1501 family)
MMNRRKFIRNSFSTAGGMMLLNGLPLHTNLSNQLLQLIATTASQNGRIMVFIQLNGGNDGLNTLIPVDQYGSLAAARQNVLIRENKVLKITGTDKTGLHPAMTSMQRLYNEGYVSAIQGVAYPNPDFSHFRATDIWLTASDANEYLNTGWVGRFFEKRYAGYPNGYPNTDMPDPLAIQIGSYLSPVLQGGSAQMGLSITDPNSFYQFTTGNIDDTPNTPYGHELKFLRFMQQQTNLYFNTVKNAADRGVNRSTLYPATNANSLSDQLKIVAKLISGGLKTPVYVVNLDGFDTHASQVQSATETDKGSHASLLEKLSVAISAFQDDLIKQNLHKNVAGMTFSELGRRIESNGSMGTDHGTAAPIFVFGAGVNPGIIGANPIIPANVNPWDNLPMQYDFRQVYRTVLNDWFELETPLLNEVFSRPYEMLPIFKKPGAEKGKDIYISKITPNPVTQTAIITLVSVVQTTGSVTLYDSLGRLLQTLLNGEIKQGVTEIPFNRKSLPAGAYMLEVRSGSQKSTSRMVLQ